MTISHGGLALSLGIALSAAPAFARAADRGGFWPDRERWRDAARAALRDPGTWVPAAGAAVIAAADWDDNISEWAVDSTPVFGSTDNALDWSNHLKGASHYAMIATALAVPGEGRPFRTKLETLLWEHAAVEVTSELTSSIKKATDRERPDGSDRFSFPSGHASGAFAYAAASSRNLAATRLAGPTRVGLGIGLKTLAAGTAWARVEAGVHFPTDVLAGATLGNFLSLLVHDASSGRQAAARHRHAGREGPASRCSCASEAENRASGYHYNRRRKCRCTGSFHMSTVFRCVLGVAIAVIALGYATLPDRAAERAAPPPRGLMAGADRSGVSADRGLLQSCPKADLLVWKPRGSARFLERGDRQRAPVHAGQREGTEYLIAFDVRDGKQVWSMRWERDTNDKAAVRGAADRGRQSHLHAPRQRDLWAVSSDGKPLWHVPILEKFKVENIKWGISERRCSRATR